MPLSTLKLTSKRGKVGPGGDKCSKIAQNGTKCDQTGPNGPKRGQTGLTRPNRAKWNQTGLIFCMHNLVSNSWDIRNMDKCRQDKCCLDKCHYDSWHLSKMVQGTYFWSLITIKSVTADIILIWTNVTWTNVAWTNVTLTLGICSRWSQEPTFKVLSKLVQ